MLSPSCCLAGLGDHCQADVHTDTGTLSACAGSLAEARPHPQRAAQATRGGSPAQGAGASVWQTQPFSVPPSLASTTLSLPLSCLVITGVQENPSGGPTFGGAAEPPMWQEG